MSDPGPGPTGEAAPHRDATFRAIIDASPVPMALNDDDQNITLVNAAFVRTFGYDAADIPTLEAWWRQAYPDPAYRQWVIDAWGTELARAARAGDPFSPIEVEVTCKSGAVRCIVAYAASLASSFRGTHMVVLYDITDRKRAEEALRRSDEARRTLARAVEQSPASVVITDRAGNIEYVNPHFEKVTGFTEAEALGKNPRILKSGLLPVETYEQLWATISRGGEWRGVLCNRTKAGELFWESAAISGLRDESGEIGHYVAVKNDISALKRVEEALVQNRRALERVQELARVGSWACDVDTLAVEGSAEAHRIYGLPLGEISLPRVQSLVLPAYRAALDAALSACLAGEATYDVEFEIRRASDGAIRHIHSLAEWDPVQRRISGFIQDVTDRKRAEDERLKLEAQFHHAQKMESVGRLAGGVAHDFNNMLGVILGYTEVAAEAVGAPHPALDALAEVRQAARRSADLTRQLLAFARQQVVAPRTVDLNAAVAGMLKLLRRLIGENVRLDWAPAAEVWV